MKQFLFVLAIVGMAVIALNLVPEYEAPSDGVITPKSISELDLLLASGFNCTRQAALYSCRK